MKSACDRYLLLTEEKRDRDLTPTESGFLADHARTCAECARLAQQGALVLDLLRGAAIDVDEPEDSYFQRRVTRRWKLQTVQSGFRFWTPVMVGAALSLLAVLAGLEMLTADRSPRTVQPFGEARRADSLPQFPTESSSRTP
jgi:hypothetical protein